MIGTFQGRIETERSEQALGADAAKRRTAFCCLGGGSPVSAAYSTACGGRIPLQRDWNCRAFGPQLSGEPR
jgi:hypothetical protein